MDIKKGLIIVKTPFRISFFGGGTDFPGYFNQAAQGGAVLGVAIDKYMYVVINSLERFFDKKIKMSYSQLEIVDQIENLNHALLREILKSHPYFNDDSFIDIHTFCDLPAASGMGSSSAFTVGTINGLYSISGYYKTPKEIALEAIDIERVKLADRGGWQDQIFSAYGGLNVIRFQSNDFNVTPLVIDMDKRTLLEKSCLLFFTGITRSSDKAQAHMSETLSTAQLQRLDNLRHMVDKGQEILSNSNTPEEMLQQFGTLLHEAWEQKRALSASISNPVVDDIYSRAMSLGAIGGKLCGAGGGGFVLMIVPPSKQPAMIAAMQNDYKILPIKFDTYGSQVIYGHSLS